MSARHIKRLAKKEAENLISPKIKKNESDKSIESQIIENIPENEEHNQEENIPEYETYENNFESDILNDLSESESEENEFNLREELAKWAIQFQISFVAINSLLLLLIKCNLKVPKDARTLLKTPSSVVERKVGEGTYIHYGLKNGLTDFLVRKDWKLFDITLDFGIDGLPPFKNSTKQAWPILGSVVESTYVFLVGVYEGMSKPNCANDFLEEFITELNVLMQEGLVFADKFFNIKVRCFVMDAPAKSFVLGTKGHSGYFCCTRCTQKGQIVKHRLILPIESECTVRTNDTFRNRSQPQHHLKQSISPLEKLNIDIISQCSLDYMHVVCLGVMRTLLNAWVNIKGEQYSLVSWKCNTISNELSFNTKNITKEFQRKPRTLKYLERWKATELRQFLLYTGPFILKNVLSSELYSHFLKLSLALRILLDHNDCKKNNNCAEKLLKSFVNEIPSFYESCFLTYNFHALMHIHEDAKLHGSLESISAFKFENYLQTIKRKVRKGQSVAAQIYKRHVETSFYLEKEEEENPTSVGKIKNGQILNVNGNGFFFSLREPDNFCLIQNKIVKITEIKKKDNAFVFVGKEIRNLTALFMYPIDSTTFNIYWSADIALDKTIIFSINDIDKKVLCLRNSSDNSYSFTPLISNVAK